MPYFKYKNEFSQILVIDNKSKLKRYYFIDDIFVGSVTKNYTGLE